MAWQREEPARTQFLDIFRYLLIFVSSGFAVFLIWKQNRILALIEALPVFIVMSNLFGFLTLPLYRRTSGLIEKMTRTFTPSSSEHLLGALDAFSLKEHRENSNERISIPVSEEMDAETEAAANDISRNPFAGDDSDVADPEARIVQPDLPEKTQIAQQMRQIISLATKAIYSEQFSDMSTLVKWLPGDKSDRNLLCAYIAIRMAAQLTKPPSDGEIENAAEQLLMMEKDPANADSGALLNLHKALAEIYWLQRQAEILRGKLAHRNGKYSYEATIYALQRVGKGPMTNEDREKFKELAREISDLERQIQEYEMESLRGADLEVYQCTREHLKIQALQDELNIRKEHGTTTELKGLMEVIEKQLKFALHPESPEPGATDVFRK